MNYYRVTKDIELRKGTPTFYQGEILSEEVINEQPQSTQKIIQPYLQEISVNPEKLYTYTRIVRVGTTYISRYSTKQR